jgi:hypothetical protein
MLILPLLYDGSASSGVGLFFTYILISHLTLTFSIIKLEEYTK